MSERNEQRAAAQPRQVRIKKPRRIWKQPPNKGVPLSRIMTMVRGINIHPDLR